jgi:exodeoxyribonuclease-5
MWHSDVEAMNRSPEQESAFDKIMNWHEHSDQKRFVLAGYAGTGKTTLAQQIEEEIGNTLFAAYTGKAADVLRNKGCPGAGTIHGFLYMPRKKKTEEGAKPKDKLAFKYNPKPEWGEADLVIVDEYSMLDSRLIEDIERDAKKVLYLGDPEQLPPVKGECSLQPDFFLKEIHRQAMDSAIIRFSKIVREGGSVPFGDHGDLSYTQQRKTAPELFFNADQIIVGRNDTRQAWNTRFRQVNKFISALPVAGDKMICLKNNHEAALFNGMIGYAKKDCRSAGNFYYLDFEELEDVCVWDGDVQGRGKLYDGFKKEMEGLERFDYAYAITCHKSQGSEFDDVLVYNQPIGDSVARRRWLYTAITRGKKHVTLVEPK